MGLMSATIIHSVQSKLTSSTSKVANVNNLQHKTQIKMSTSPQKKNLINHATLQSKNLALTP